LSREILEIWYYRVIGQPTELTLEIGRRNGGEIDLHRRDYAADGRTRMKPEQ